MKDRNVDIYYINRRLLGYLCISLKNTLSRLPHYFHCIDSSIYEGFLYKKESSENVIPVIYLIRSFGRDASW